jgi:hypothetical protein
VGLRSGPAGLGDVAILWFRPRCLALVFVRKRCGTGEFTSQLGGDASSSKNRGLCYSTPLSRVTCHAVSFACSLLPSGIRLDAISLQLRLLWRSSSVGHVTTLPLARTVLLQRRMRDVLRYLRTDDQSIASLLCRHRTTSLKKVRISPVSGSHGQICKFAIFACCQVIG